MAQNQSRPRRATQRRSEEAPQRIRRPPQEQGPWGWGEQRPFVTSLRMNFVETRICELRLVPSPMGENFSGSCIVTSRNPLIHIGATIATKSGCFDPKKVQ